MRTVLITGASRGIGAATARLFAADGWDVAINYNRSRAQAEALAEELARTGVRAVALQADVADPAQAERLVCAAQRELGELDTLVCNAGIALPQQLVTDTTDEQWRRVFSVNIDGVFYTIRAAVPGFVRRKAGTIVTVSSVWGVTGGSCEVAYSASKGAVIAMTKALAKELGPSGIAVNCVAPGVIDTQMNADVDSESLQQLCQDAPLSRMGTPEEVARCILFLAQANSAYLTGQIIQPDGGMFL